MQKHHGDRKHDAEHDLDSKIPSSLSFARNQGSAIRVHDLGEATEDTRQSASNTHAARGHEFGMDIAKDVAIPPRSDVVCRPDKGIGEVKQIQN